MIYHGLIHTCRIDRPGHTITGGKKDPLALATSATLVECRIEPLADTESVSVLGKTASETYLGIFPDGTDLRIGDELVWTDRTPNVVFTVDGQVERSNAALQSQDHHLEAFLTRRDLTA